MKADIKLCPNCPPTSKSKSDTSSDSQQKQETSQTSKMVSVRLIIEMKAAASATITKMSAILDLQSAWYAEDENLATLSLRVRLACEYVSDELQAFQQLCQQLISLPPPYTADHPDERHHQLLELDVLLYRTYEALLNLFQSITTLKKESEQNLTEVEERAKDALDQIREKLSELRHDDELVGENDAGDEDDVTETAATR